MHANLRRVHARDLRGDRLVEVGHLVPAPDFEHAVAVHPRDRVQWLQRGMGEVGELEGRFDHLRRTGEP